MRSLAKFMLGIVLVTFLSGCCIKFSDVEADATYNVGDTITTSGTDILVERFQYGNNEWTDGGSARVDTQRHARGSGHDLKSGNVNLHFQFDYPLDRITLKFGELGGNINIKVNDEFQNVRDLISLNGTTIGGVQVTVDAYQEGNNWYGKMALEGDINDFLIGGQELWLDDICTSK